ncbi:tRNA (adenosine(37)-N6)-dimethylallyltransferase MiaA [Actinomyces sp. MRS3W]|uniref:tRNA (adenosine(37)-N6)-dimethylallyltransferase MiaA n=1 Tax=Actinomyces sp. MRS3W TaxID=2800796 RepID=UPI0028FCFE2A|nr:tRNA (adenosine(37)-N6)-dimethylallyltransferase MiaA [Actinomyces sp. MRS3W]MDU0347479.1 tRNA (adenosine(37)-N6)-dimethylallyltransferase MiaA [Actinomyces sp. MRS3W]
MNHPAARQSEPVRVAVVGPTATGKSDLALDLADALGGRCEMINADAFQLYRGMNIGTAKLPVSERRGYPHHQLDVLEVTQEANVASYQRHARADLEAITARGRRPIMVGGSGLYVRAVTDALDFPGTDPAVRAAFQDRADAEGAARLWEELREADPEAAARIEPSNTRRIVRALEVIQLTGRPFTASLPRYADLAPTVHLALRLDRAALNARIDARAATMFSSGLLEETEALLASGLREGPTAARAIGYAQAIAVLDGHLTRQEAAAETAAATRKLASRQIKWFRRDPRVHWLDVAVDAAGQWRPGERERVVAEAVRIVRAGAAVAQPERTGEAIGWGP